MSLAPPASPPATAPAIDLSALPPGAVFARILGVNYFRLRTEDGGDLYLTQHGLPFWRQLLPWHWYEEQWFKSHRTRLEGTGTVYRLPTRPIEGRRPESIDLVVKWSRVGEDVPLDTLTLQRAITAEFNTPFEEFSLLEDLRRGEYGPRELRIRTQKPLAIYVPPERMQLWQTGRSAAKILSKVQRHPAVEIDILRSYIMLYQWVDGVTAIEAMNATSPSLAQMQIELSDLTHAVDQDLRRKGFVVADHKPAHVIVRVRNGQLLRRQGSDKTYAVVDYELLNRTPEYEQAVSSARRTDYLRRQRDRFEPQPASAFRSADVKPFSLLGVDYVYGSTASTHGQLWVVGNDPELFGYFLPERWRHKQVLMSPRNQTYYVQTKDRIHLLWKVSSIGDQPEDLSLQEHGFNSPFEEFACALDLAKRGVPTVHPRAIYATGEYLGVPGCVADARRFEEFGQITLPDGQPLMRPDQDYITIWGWWRGVDDVEAFDDLPRWSAIDAAQAHRAGMLTQVRLDRIVRRQARRLRAAGYVDLNLRGEHILLSYRPGGSFKTDATGELESPHCNFEFVRRI